MRTTVAVVMLLAGAVGAGAQERLSDQLRKGVVQEEVNQDLGKAIAAYEAIVAQYDEDRRAAASALFRLAECSRKAGRRDQAVRAYQRVVREFPEQADVAEPSRRQLRDTYGIAETRATRETSEMADLERRLAEAQQQLRQYQTTREVPRERNTRSLEALQEELRRSGRPLGTTSAELSTLERGLADARMRLDKGTLSEADYQRLAAEYDATRDRYEDQMLQAEARQREGEFALKSVENQILVIEQRIQAIQRRVELGLVPKDDRELIDLRRELASLQTTAQQLRTGVRR